MGLFNAVNQITETARSAPPLGEDATDDERRDAHYHRRIVVVAACFAAIGLLAGAALSVMTALTGPEDHTARQLILVPVIFGVVGFVFGTAVMCFFAPEEFLTGPAGAPWMRLIGTQSVTVARVACLLFGLVIAVPIISIAVFIAIVE